MAALDPALQVPDVQTVALTAAELQTAQLQTAAVQEAAVQTLAVQPPAVLLRGIDKHFGAVHANRHIDLRVAPGSIHGIVGENGAGKSTLMAILYGLLAPDSGDIEVDGRRVQFRSARDAMACGIGMVHQHFMLIEDFSALDNVLLGAAAPWRLAPGRAQVRAQLLDLMQQTGLQLRMDMAVGDMPVGERQRLEILKALLHGARILILDEPTAVLTPQETEQLFATLRLLRSSGTTVLLISHKLKEIMALCDDCTALRDGAVVQSGPCKETSAEALAQAMVGRSVLLGRPAAAAVAAPAAALLSAQDLVWKDSQGITRLGGVSLTLHAGEIVGIAGVSGNGQSELLEVLAGLLVPQAGSLRLGETRYDPARWLNPAQARAARLAHVPEDRHRRGLVLDFPAWESAVLGYQSLPRYSPWGVMLHGMQRDDTRLLMERYDVRPRQPRLPTAQFSGGNQQKLLLARETFHAPKVLLVGQPTRGVDIGAIEFIHQRLRALRDAGGAVLLVSSELDEILALADRVLVLQAGRCVGELPIEDCSEAALGRLMGGLELVG